MVSCHWAQSTKHIRYEPIGCYHWPTGCSKYQTYVPAVPLCIIPTWYTATCCYAAMLLLVFWNYDARHSVQQRYASDGCVWFVRVGCRACWVAFCKGFQLYGKALFGRKKRKKDWGWRIGHSSILIYLVDWKIGHQNRQFNLEIFQKNALFSRQFSPNLHHCIAVSLVSWFCDHRACISRRKNRHGHWMCWMSTGRKNGLMWTHTTGIGVYNIPGIH